MAKRKAESPVEPAPPESGPTTWMDRFRAGLASMCGGSVPPLDMCQEWKDGEEVNGQWRLQDWVACHVALHWATGIGTIEAAEVWAETPTDGDGHLDKDE